MSNQLPGVSAPFDVVMTGTDKLIREIDRITAKVAALERIQVGGEKPTLDTSKIEKSIERVRRLTQKTAADFASFEFPDTFKGTKAGDSLRKATQEISEEVTGAVAELNGGLMDIERIVQKIAQAGKTRMFPAGQLKQYNTELNGVASLIGRIGKDTAGVIKKFEAARTGAGQIVSKQITGGSATKSNVNVDDMKSDIAEVRAIGQEFNRLAEEAENKLQALTDASNVSFQPVANAMVTNFNKAFTNIGSTWKSEVSKFAEVLKGSSISQSLAQEIMSPEVATAIASLQEKLGQIDAHSKVMSQTQSDLDNAETDEDRETLAQEYMSQIVKAENLARQGAQAQKALADSYFSNQIKLANQLKTTAEAAGTDFKGNAEAINKIAERTTQLKSAFGDTLQEIGLGANVLRNQEALQKNIVNILREGGNLEAENVAGKLRGLDIYARTMDYVGKLRSAESKLTANRRDNVAILKTSLEIMREQANALRTAMIAGNGEESLKAFNDLVKLQGKIGAQSGEMRVKQSIADMSDELSSGAVPNMRKLNDQIIKYEAQSGKSFTSSKENVELLNALLGKSEALYHNMGKAASAADVKTKENALQQIEVLNKRLQNEAAPDNSADRRAQYIEERKQALAITKQEVEFNERLVQDFNKIQALQVAGVNVASNYAKLQELYVQAKIKESSIEGEIANQLKNKKQVVEKLAHEVEGMRSASTDTNLLPDMQRDQLKGVIDTLETILALTKNIEEKGLKNKPVDKNGEVISSQAIEAQLSAARQLKADKDEEIQKAQQLKLIDESVLGLVRQRNQAERDIITTLKASEQLMERRLMTYETYKTMLNAIMDAKQKGISVDGKADNLEKARVGTINKLAEEYTNLNKTTANQVDISPAMRNESLRRQLKLLMQISELMDDKMTVHIDGHKAETSLVGIKDSIAGIERELIQMDSKWGGVSKNFMKYNPGALAKLEAQLEVITSSTDALEKEFLDVDKAGGTFNEVFLALAKAESPINATASSLKKLHNEQLANAAATDKQRVATMADLAIAEKRKDVYASTKAAMQGLRDKTQGIGVDMDDLMGDPAEVLNNVAADPKQFTVLKTEIERTITAVAQLRAVGKGDTGYFGKLADGADTYISKLNEALAKMDKLDGLDSRVDLSKVETTPEATASTRMAEEQKLLRTIQEQYLALQQGVDVLKNWSEIRKNVNEASRRGLDLGKENLAVLSAQDNITQKMTKHAEKLYADANDETSGLPVESRVMALQEAEQIARNMRREFKAMSDEAGQAGMDKLLGQIRTLKSSLPYVPEALQKAQDQAEIFTNELRTSVQHSKRLGESVGDAYGKIDAIMPNVTSALADYKRSQEAIYKNADFISNSSDKEIVDLRTKVRESDKLHGIMKKIAALSAKQEAQASSLGVDTAELGTAGGAAALHRATINDPKAFVDINNTNKEMKVLLKSLEDGIKKSGKLGDEFKEFVPNIKAAEAQIDRVNTTLSKYAESKGRKAARAAGSNMFDIFRMSWFVQLRGFWGMYMGLTETIQAVTEYTHTMNVMKGVTSASAKTMGTLNSKFMELGETVPIALTKTTEAALNVAKAGMDAQETIKIVEAASRLAYATKSDITIVADIITVITRAWGKSAEDAGPIADTLFAAISKSRASIEGLQQAMGYLSGIAPQANVSLEQTLGLVGVLTNAGLSMSKAATYSRQVLNDLMNPSAKLIRILNGLGVSLSDVDPRFNKLADIFKRLHGAGMDVSQAFEGMSVRGANAFALALSNADSMEEFTESLAGSKALMDEFGGTTKDLASSFQLLMNSFTNTANGLSGAVGPVIMGIIDGIRNLLGLVQDLVQWLGSIGGGSADGLQLFVNALTTMSPLILLAVIGFKRFDKIAAALTKTFTALRATTLVATTSVKGLSASLIAAGRASLALIFSPWGLLIATLAGVGYAFSQMYDSGSDKLSALTESVKQLGEEIKKYQVIQVELQRTETLGQRFTTLKENYSDELKGEDADATKNAGQLKNMRASVRGFLSAVIQEGSDEAKVAAQDFMSSIFDPTEGAPKARLWMQKMVSEMSEVLSSAKLDVFDQALANNNSYLAGFDHALAKTDAVMGNLKDRIATIQDGAAKDITYSWRDFFLNTINPVDEVRALIGGLTDTFSPDQIAQDAGGGTANLLQALTAVPANQDTLPMLTEGNKKLEDTIKLLKSVTEAYRATGDHGAESLTKLTALTARLTTAQVSLMSKINKAKSHAGMDEKLGDVQANSQMSTDTSKRQDEAAVQQDIQREVTQLKAESGSLKYGVQLAFLAPTKQNREAVKTKLQNTVEGLGQLMQRVDDPNYGRSLSTLNQDSGKKVMDAMKEAWEAQIELMQAAGDEGSLSLDRLIGAAYNLKKTMNFDAAGISFSAFIKKVGLGQMALKDIKAEAKNVPLESYDQLGRKIEYIAKNLDKMKRMGGGIPKTVIATTSQLIEKLTKKQFDYMQAVLKANMAVNRAQAATATFDSAMRNLGGSYDVFEGTDFGASSIDQSSVNIGKALDDQMITMRSSLNEAKSGYEEFAQSIGIAKDELDALGEITGQNADEAMRTEQIYSKMAATGASQLSTLRDSIIEGTKQLGTMQESLRSLKKEFADDQFEFQGKQLELKRAKTDNSYDFAYQQQDLNRKDAQIKEQASSGLLKGDALVSALQELRDSYMDFAVANPYEKAGSDAAAKAEQINNKLVALQASQQLLAEKRMRMQELNNQMQLAIYSRLEATMQGIWGVLEKLHNLVGDAKTSNKKKAPADAKAKAPTKAKNVGGKTKAQPNVKAHSKGGAAPTAGASKQPSYDELQAQFNALQDETVKLQSSIVTTEASIKDLGDAMEVQAAQTLTFEEAMKDWVDTLGTSKEIMQNMFNSNYNTMKDTVSGSISQGLKSLATGEDFDLDAMLWDMNWKMVDNFVQGSTDMAFRSLGTGMDEWNPLMGTSGEKAEGETVKQVGNTIQNAESNINPPVGAQPGDTAMGGAIQQFNQGVQQFMQAIQQFLTGTQTVQQQEQANLTAEQANKATEQAQDAVKNTQETQTAAMNMQAASTDSMAAGQQMTAAQMQQGAAQTQAASGGGGGGGMLSGFMNGFMGFFGMGGMFAEGGLITDGNRQKDSTVIGAKKDEFVVQQSAVDKFGVPFMQALNEGNAGKAFDMVPNAPAFGQGNDSVTGRGASLQAPPPASSAAPGRGEGGSDKRSIRINNVVDPQVVEKYLGSDKGRRAINNVVSKSPYKTRG